MGFSILSWNVEHFEGGPRTKDVVAHIKDQDPDVFGLLEMEGTDVLAVMQGEFPKYDFSLTDGPQVQEILVGVRRGKFDQVGFTQKREFKAYNPSLRPGLLTTLRQGTETHNLLFLHTDSGVLAPDFGNRAEMFEKIGSLKKAIDKIAKKAGNLVVLGDLNTMGLQFPKPRKKDSRVAADEEIAALGGFAAEWGMGLLPKDLDHTWTGSAGDSNLDHVVASTGLKFKTLGQRPDGSPAKVLVRGWQQLQGAAKKAFVAEVSDHCSLFAEVT